MKKENKESPSGLFGVLGTFLVMVIMFSAIKYLPDYAPSLVWLAILYFLALLICYPFFRGSELIWWRKTPIPFRIWLIHNAIVSVIIFFILKLLTEFPN